MGISILQTGTIRIRPSHRTQSAGLPVLVRRANVLLDKASTGPLPITADGINFGIPTPAMCRNMCVVCVDGDRTWLFGGDVSYDQQLLVDRGGGACQDASNA